MRLTLVLCKNNVRRIYKDLWKHAQVQKVKETETLQKLKTEGIPIVDALELTKKKSTDDHQLNFPEFWVDKTSPPPVDPNWQDRICHFFTPDSCLLEGEPHSQSLTKTHKIDGLPPALKDFVSNVKIEHIEESARRAVLHSHIWDSYQKKLFPLHDKERPWYTFKRPYGIPNERKISLLLSSLIRIGDVYEFKPSRYEPNTIFTDIHASSPIEKDVDLLQFRVTSNFVLTSSKFLPPINEPSASIDKSIPDIYPLKSTLDLKQENIYELIDYCTIPKTAPHPFLRTLFLSHPHKPESYSRTQIIGQAIGTCFGFAVAQARQHFGHAVKKLPHPIVLQCVQTDGQLFNFMVYQLNTLDISGIDGTKNVVWLDSGHELMQCCEKVGGQVKFEGFNPEVVKRFLALYLNGLH